METPPTSLLPYSSSLPSPLFFPMPTAEKNTVADLPIYFSPEAYGTWESFIQHADFRIAALQYKKLFSELDSLIAQYCLPSPAMHRMFAHFFAEIEAGAYLSHEPLLYGEGKATFTLFYILLHDDTIALEKKTNALYQLIEAIDADAEKTINRLITITRQLQYAKPGGWGESLRVRDHLIEQLVLKYSIAIHGDKGKETPYVATYLHFIRNLYDPLLLTYSAYTERFPLAIGIEDLKSCKQYVDTHLTDEVIISSMAETYHAEVKNRLATVNKIGLTFKDMSQRLMALKAKLTPLYGDIPNTALLQEKAGRYYVIRQNTLIKVALVGTCTLYPALLQSVQVFRQYPLFSPASCRETNKYPIKNPILPEEKVSIYQAGSLYWVNLEKENISHLVTLTHLKPLATDRDLPAALLQEAFYNSRPDELQAALSLWILNPVFFTTYIPFLFQGQEKEAINILIVLFNQAASDEETGAQALYLAFQQLKLPVPIIALIVKKIPLHVIFWLLAKTLQNLLEHQSIRLINSEALLHNLIKAGFPATAKDSTGATLLMQAACQGWLSAVKTLQQKGALIDAVNIKQQTAVMLAALYGQLKIVKHLCAAGANLTLLSQTGCNTLMYAVIGKDRSTIEYLLARRNVPSPLTSAFFPPPLFTSCDINARDHQGRTALLCLFENLEEYGELDIEDISHLKNLSTSAIPNIAHLLLQHGADIHARTATGNSVLTYDTIYSSGCFDLLWRAGAHAHGKDSFLILCNAIRHNQLIALLTFMHAKVPVHTPADWAVGNCPISEAIAGERWDIALLLLAHGQSTLTHLLRVKLFHFITKKLVDQHIPTEYIHPLLYRTLNPAFIAFPDPQGSTFFDCFISYLNTVTDNGASVIKNMEPAHLTRQMDVLKDYVDMLLPLKDGDTILMHLIKQRFSQNENWLPLIRYLAEHIPLSSVKDKAGFTPLMRAQQQKEPFVWHIFPRTTSRLY
jgi:ankyrin repeat protein